MLRSSLLSNCAIDASFFLHDQIWLIVHWFSNPSIQLVLLFTSFIVHFVCRSPGYAALPKAYVPLAESSKVESSGESTSVGQQFPIPGGHANSSFPQFANCVFVPFQVPGANGNSGEGSSNNQNIPDSQVEAQKKNIQQQIEVSFFYWCYFRFFYVICVFQNFEKLS